VGTPVEPRRDLRHGATPGGRSRARRLRRVITWLTSILPMRGELPTAGYKALDRSVGRVVGGMTAAAGLSLLTLALAAFAFRESPLCVGRKHPVGSARARP
jgi:hypothetical protein